MAMFMIELYHYNVPGNLGGENVKTSDANTQKSGLKTGKVSRGSY